MLLLHLIQPLTEGLYQIKRLNGLHILQCFAMEGHHLTADIAHLLAEGAHFSHKGLGHQQCKGCGQQRQQRHGGIIPENDDQRDQELRQLDDQGGHPAQHAVGDGGDIGIDAVEQIAGVELLQGLPVRGGLSANHTYPPGCKISKEQFEITITSLEDNIIGFRADSGEMMVTDVDLRECQSLEYLCSSWLIEKLDVTAIGPCFNSPEG